MIKWEIRTQDLTSAEAEVLSQFWHGGDGPAIGFRINTLPSSRSGYVAPQSKRALAERIMKAIKKEKAD